MSPLRTRMTVALTFAAGAFLYFSDHDTIDRHWRLALALSLGAVLLAVSPLWSSARSIGRSGLPARAAGSRDVHVSAPVDSRPDFLA